MWVAVKDRYCGIRQKNRISSVTVVRYNGTSVIKIGNGGVYYLCVFHLYLGPTGSRSIPCRSILRQGCCIFPWRKLVHAVHRLLPSRQLFSHSSLNFYKGMLYVFVRRQCKMTSWWHLSISEFHEMMTKSQGWCYVYVGNSYPFSCSRLWWYLNRIQSTFHQQCTKHLLHSCPLFRRSSVYEYLDHRR